VPLYCPHFRGSAARDFFHRDCLPSLMCSGILSRLILMMNVLVRFMSIPVYMYSEVIEEKVSCFEKKKKEHMYMSREPTLFAYFDLQID